MNKIREYIRAELANLEAERKELVDNRHRCELSIESIDKAIRMLREGMDSTGNVFKPADGDLDDSGREIMSLREQRESLVRDAEVMQKRIVCIDNKLVQLKDINNDKNVHGGEGYRIIATREDERQRIARDIHDSVIQKMTALIHKTEFAQRVMEQDAQRAKLELELINNVMHECVDELRSIIYDLRPTALSDIGFRETVEDYVSQSSRNTDMNINLTIDDSSLFNRIDDVIAVSALRIIQELTGNSIKHSHGNNIDIGIYIDKGNLIIKCSDDGNGFDANTTSDKTDKSGFGTKIVKERVELLNGSIQCNHINGTSYYISIPCIFNLEEKDNVN